MLYFCNSAINHECPKTSCLFEGRGTTGVVCFATTKVDYAMRDADGRPIVFDAEGKTANERGGDN